MRKTIFAYARMNPPTKGHKLLVDKVVSTAMNASHNYRIVVSHSHDRLKNPLYQERKMEYVRASFPGVDFVPSSPDLPSFVQHIQGLSSTTDHVTIVAGPDRISEYWRVLERASRAIPDFPKYDVVQVGDVVGREMYSGSAARLAAREERYENFSEMVLTGDVTHAMYLDVRTGLGLINTSTSYGDYRAHGEKDYQG